MLEFLEDAVDLPQVEGCAESVVGDSGQESSQKGVPAGDVVSIDIHVVLQGGDEGVDVVADEDGPHAAEDSQVQLFHLEVGTSVHGADEDKVLGGCAEDFGFVLTSAWVQDTLASLQGEVALLVGGQHGDERLELCHGHPVDFICEEDRQLGSRGSGACCSLPCFGERTIGPFVARSTVLDDLVDAADHVGSGGTGMALEEVHCRAVRQLELEPAVEFVYAFGFASARGADEVENRCRETDVIQQTGDYSLFSDIQ